MNESFETTATRFPTYAVVAVSGELDAYTVPQLRECTQRLVGDGVERLVFDLRRVTFLDSTGLGALVGIKKRLRAGEKTMCLVVEDDQPVRRVFEITRVDKALPIHPTVEAAVHDCAGVA